MKIDTMLKALLRRTAAPAFLGAGDRLACGRNRTDGTPGDA